MIDTPQIVQTEPQLMAYIHVTVPRDKIREVMGPGLAEIHATLAAQGIVAAGPSLTHHLRNPSDIFDFEIGVPVKQKVAPAGRVKPGELPTVTVARTVYHGPYEALGAGWGEFQAWIADNGYESAVDLWERYLSGPESGSDPSQWRTELNRPVTKK